MNKAGGKEFEIWSPVFWRKQSVKPKNHPTCIFWSNWLSCPVCTILWEATTDTSRSQKLALLCILWIGGLKFRAQSVPGFPRLSCTLFCLCTLYSFPSFEPVCFSTFDSNAAFWPAYRFFRRQVSWYSHLFKNFPVCCDPHKGFSIVNEVGVFLEFLCSLRDPMNVGNLIVYSSASLQPS